MAFLFSAERAGSRCWPLHRSIVPQSRCDFGDRSFWRLVDFHRDRGFFRPRWLQRLELAFDQRGRPEMALPTGHAGCDHGAAAGQMNDGNGGADGRADAVAISALEG